VGLEKRPDPLETDRDPLRRRSSSRGLCHVDGAARRAPSPFVPRRTSHRALSRSPPERVGTSSSKAGTGHAPRSAGCESLPSARHGKNGSSGDEPPAAPGTLPPAPISGRRENAPPPGAERRKPSPLTKSGGLEGAAPVGDTARVPVPGKTPDRERADRAPLEVLAGSALTERGALLLLAAQDLLALREEGSAGIVRQAVIGSSPSQARGSILEKGAGLWNDSAKRTHPGPDRRHRRRRDPLADPAIGRVRRRTPQVRVHQSEGTSPSPCGGSCLEDRSNCRSSSSMPPPGRILPRPPDRSGSASFLSLSNHRSARKTAATVSKPTASSPGWKRTGPIEPVEVRSLSPRSRCAAGNQRS
jgi:hypothetical protein